MTKIKVALRVRPLSAREIKGSFPIVIGVQQNSAFLTDIRVPEHQSADSRQRFRQFEFDHGFSGATQEEVYNKMGQPLENSILEGYNACLLAYGQSGTGKTHTMLGSKEDPGIIPRLCESLLHKFRVICEKEGEGAESSFKMEVSYMEIYREKVRDLLSSPPSLSPPKKLKLREHPQLGPHVQNLSRVEVEDGGGILELLWAGEGRRAVGATGSNKHSSRSHAIWTLYLTHLKTKKDGTQITKRNQVHLVDLAGSEKADLITTKSLLAEGKDINRSLVSLGNVISSLAERAQYIPYRDSALTWLLKDSLGGNATTAIIITASPASSSHAQTLNSFRFAQRARLVEIQPKINITKSTTFVVGKNESRNGESSSGIFSISHFDLKRDITKLANMIRSAQNNGGILSGFTPRNGWNRLISAIENWNHYETKTVGENCKNLNKRDSSVDTSTSDVMVQANLAQTDSDSSTSQSIKCLTWKQEEIKVVPKESTATLNELTSEKEKNNPIQSPKIKHMQFLFPIHCPTVQNIESDGRISEKIHGTLPPLSIEKISNYITHISPLEESRLLTTQKLPELRCSGKVHKAEQLTTVLCANDSFGESSNNENIGLCTALKNDSDHKSLTNEGLNFNNSVNQDSGYEISTTQDSCCEIVIDNCADYNNLVNQESGYDISSNHNKETNILTNENSGNTTNFSFNIPKASEFSPCQSSQVPIFEKRYEESGIFKISPIVTRKFNKLRLVSPGKALLRENDSNSEIAMSNSSISEISSSSYESLNSEPICSSTPKGVKIVQKNVFDFKEIEDSVNEILDKGISPIRPKMFETVEENFGAIEENFEIVENNVPYIRKVLNGTTESKFRNHFIKEFHQIETLGREIKNLKTLTQRYNVLEPYLEKIDRLNYEDHFIPDEVLDKEIEECSGWDIKIEYEKVQNEMREIQKILRKGPSGRTKSSESSSASLSSSGSISIRSRRNSSSSASASSSLNQRAKNKIFNSSEKRGNGNTNALPESFWQDFYRSSRLDENEEKIQIPILPKTQKYLNELGKSGSLNCSCPFQSHGQIPNPLSFNSTNRGHNYESLLSSDSSSMHDGSYYDYVLDPHSQRANFPHQHDHHFRRNRSSKVSASTWTDSENYVSNLKNNTQSRFSYTGNSNYLSSSSNFSNGVYERSENVPYNYYHPSEKYNIEKASQYYFHHHSKKFSPNFSNNLFI